MNQEATTESCDSASVSPNWKPTSMNSRVWGVPATGGYAGDAESKYRRLHESMMDAFVSVDAQGRITEANPAYRAMLGYTEDELRHLTYMDVTPAKWHAFEARITAEQLLVKGYSETYEKEYRRKDGTVFPVELRTFLIRDREGQPASMWAIVRDITQRKQVEQALNESERLLKRSQIVAAWALMFWISPRGCGAVQTYWIMCLDRRGLRTLRGRLAALIHPCDRAMMIDYFRNEFLAKAGISIRNIASSGTTTRLNAGCMEWVNWSSMPKGASEPCSGLFRTSPTADEPRKNFGNLVTNWKPKLWSARRNCER